MKPLDKIRLYRPTVSRFKDILTPTGRVSGGMGRYIDDIIRWSFYGDDEYNFSSVWTERGKELEEAARREYIKTYLHNDTVLVPPFIFNKQHLCGCYLDGVTWCGCIEIKCLKENNHRSIIDSQSIPIKFKPQLQGTLLVTGLPWIDFIAYCPGEEIYVERVRPDKDYLGKLIPLLGDFNNRLESKFNKIKEEICRNT